MRDLSASAFKCYLTLVMNKDNFELDYSPEYISSVASICKDTARKSMKELCEKGYLIQVDNKNFNFYEYPRFVAKKEETIDNEKREIIDESTGEVYHYSFSQLRKYVNEERAREMWKEAKIIYD